MLILENDSNAEVRRAVLSCIAMSPRTLPKVIKRTQDIKENVRKLAYQVATNAVKYGGINVHVHMQQHNKSCVLYLTKHFSISKELSIFVCFLFKVLAEKVHIKALTIAQRVSLLQQGLHDTSGNGDFCPFVWDITFTPKSKIISSCNKQFYFYLFIN